MDLEAIVSTMCDTARAAGEFITNAKHIEVSVKEGHANFVTTMDKASQKLITEGLTGVVEGANFVGEEDAGEHLLKPGYNWIIDPIDGTMNYIKGLCHSSISIALVKDHQPVAGVIYNPYIDEMFSAIAGKGAKCNGKEIHISDASWKNGVISFGSTPYDVSRCKNTFKILSDIAGESGDVRRMASAALDFCYVACGKYDGFFELQLQVWDYAAGYLIAKEAGAMIHPIDCEKFDYAHPSGFYCANEACGPHLEQIISKYVKVLK